MTILQAISSLVLCLLALPSVAAHGYLAYLGIVDGQSYTNYTGNVPNADPSPSVIRQVSDISPVKGASNPDLNCGLNAQFAQKVASANPGDLLVFDWRGGDNTNWPHNTGPMLTYMTSCGRNRDRHERNFKRFSRLGPTERDERCLHQRYSTIYDFPGNYLIRHEIIALHLATELGGAEFYPACSQVKVGGSQTGMATDSEMVLLPGAYTDTDPGIYDPDVYSSNSYTFPGPPIAAFVSAAASSSGSSSSSSTSSATSPASTGSTSGSSSSSGVQSVCKLQRRTQSSAESVARRSLKHSSHLPLGIQESRQQKGLRLHSLWGDLVTTFSALRLGGLEIAKGGQSAMY
ncbi:glycosyl hydrolase family 61-domain-containing protein [Lentinula guzmanii]|uniref:lytic cellulose monooxygenase (C4-dehydrogenating) n=1 Tax=Lentinula guzmanii TaxID=2804957 RepID=A0AA38JGF5_9AGAR|nr:glycosyl hydrolase family 61-domain-containing protein [Lentinula guzmanii]